MKVRRYTLLKNISCDAFIKNGELRKPIVFKPGLNVIIGGSQGDNSIGKSTFLMIIYFMFGDNDYPIKEAIVIKNIGNHIIKYEFLVNGYYFTRSTDNIRLVQICNSEYDPVQTWQLDEYQQFLVH